MFLYTNVLALRLFQKGFHLLISLLDFCKAPHPTDGEDAEPAGVVADRRGSPSGRPVIYDVIVIGSAPPTRHFDVDTHCKDTVPKIGKTNSR